MSERRGLLERLLVVSVAACSPRTEGAPLGDAAPAPPSADLRATSSASVSSSASALPPAATPAPAASSAAPAASASAAPVAGLASAAASSTPRKAIPIPPEPHCGSGMCMEEARCIKASSKPFEVEMPEPFERCAPALDIGGFSRLVTEQRRKSMPDLCCYVRTRRPARGRPFEVGGKTHDAPLLRRLWG